MAVTEALILANTAVFVVSLDKLPSNDSGSYYLFYKIVAAILGTLIFRCSTACSKWQKRNYHVAVEMIAMKLIKWELSIVIYQIMCCIPSSTCGRDMMALHNEPNMYV